jgi:LacI family transcriptional regulator
LILLEALGDTDIPIVIIGENSHVGNFTSIDIDDFRTAYDLTNYLLDHGHRRIAIVGGDGPCYHARCEGFRRAYAERGLKPCEEMVIAEEWIPSVYADARRSLEKLLSLPAQERPTAVFGHNDVFAISAIRTIREFGLRVPQDISVVGIDDEPEAQAMDLTTMRQDPRLVGKRAAELLLDLIDGNVAPGNKELLPTELIVRGSVARITV